MATSARFFGFFTSAPLFGIRISRRAIFFASIALGFLVAPALGIRVSPADAPLAIALSTVLGLLQGLVFLFFVAIFQVAGGIIDLQAGLSIIGVIDPTTGERVNLTGQILIMGAILYMWTTGLYKLVITGVVKSLTIIPAGSFPKGIADAAIKVGILAIVTGVYLALPIWGAAVLTEIAIGLLSRAVPQINAFIMSLPAKVLVILALFSMAVGEIFKGESSWIMEFVKVIAGRFSQ